ncbi:MAG: Tox-REase-5 domain-containing protein [Oscillospiraceae bacterium]|nr:Tox-REase-5 domain-containing protein [Oscillospiraceae bacterium]
MEVKGDYSSFVGKNGQFQSWFSGGQGLIDQANRQLSAAGGTAIDWYVSNQASLNAMKDLFAREGIKGINFILQAPK